MCQKRSNFWMLVLLIVHAQFSFGSRRWFIVAYVTVAHQQWYKNIAQNGAYTIAYSVLLESVESDVSNQWMGQSWVCTKSSIFGCRRNKQIHERDGINDEHAWKLVIAFLVVTCASHNALNISAIELTIFCQDELCDTRAHNDAQHVQLWLMLRRV